MANSATPTVLTEPGAASGEAVLWREMALANERPEPGLTTSLRERLNEELIEPPIATPRRQTSTRD